MTGNMMDVKMMKSECCHKCCVSSWSCLNGRTPKSVAVKLKKAKVVIMCNTRRTQRRETHVL